MAKYVTFQDIFQVHLPLNEILILRQGPNPELRCIAGKVLGSNVLLVRGDLKMVLIPRTYFFDEPIMMGGITLTGKKIPPEKKIIPDYSRFEIKDAGCSLAFGDWEIPASMVFEEWKAF